MKIAINSLAVCVAASIVGACSQAKPDDGQAGQDTSKTSMASEGQMNFETEISDPKPSNFSTLATATTFDAIGITPRSYCERSDLSECGVDFLPISTVKERGVPEPSNPYRLVRQDGAFGPHVFYPGSLIFPADLDPQFIAYFAPNYVNSDDFDINDFHKPGTSDDHWYETALLPVTWRQTGCSGIMGISMYRGTEHPRDSFFFLDASGDTWINTFPSWQKMSVELTVSGYQISTEYGEMAALTIVPDNEGRCVVKVESEE